jgi:hypothetical protein
LAASIAKARRSDARLVPVIERIIRNTGVTSALGIAAELQRMNVQTPSGRGRWHAVMVTRLLQRTVFGRPRDGVKRATE